MENIYVEIDNLSKRFLIPKQNLTLFRTLNNLAHGIPLKREFWALKEVSFKVCQGDKLAIVGKNGSGKTTLLRFLAGIYEKTSGRVAVYRQPNALFRWWVGFNIELSVLDNIYLFGAFYGLDRQYLKNRIDEIMRVAELEELCFIPLRGLSSGQFQKLAFSIFMHVDSDFLVFDESLGFVDRSFELKAEVYFQNLYSSRKTIVIASHDTDFLKKYCKTALWLEAGRVRMSGPVEQVLSAYMADTQQS